MTDCILCERLAVSRGLCKRCYYAAWKFIRDGETTEKHLVAEGLMLEPAKRGPKVTSPMAAALARMKKK